jgi:hypothetical protein
MGIQVVQTDVKRGEGASTGAVEVAVAGAEGGVDEAADGGGVHPPLGLVGVGDEIRRLTRRNRSTVE